MRGKIVVWVVVVFFLMVIPLVNASSMRTGLVGEWAFDGGYGTTAYDTSGYGNHGSFGGDPQWTFVGKQGKALVFDGSDDYVDCGNIDILGGSSQATWSAWVKPIGSGESTWQSIITTWNDPTNTWVFDLRYQGMAVHLKTDAGTTAYYCYDGESGCSNFITYGEWTHVAATFNNGALIIYANGVEQKSFSPVGNTIAYKGSNEKLLIAGDRDGNVANFNGTIDEVRIWDRALSAEEIKGLYNQGSVRFGSEESWKPGLVGRWKFDEGGGSTAYDETSNNNDGTIIGATWQSESDGCKRGNCIEIDSDSDYVDISDIGGSTISVTMWYYYGGIGGGGWNTLLCRDGGTYHHVLIQDSDRNIGFYNNGWYPSGYALTVGQWYHIALVKSGTNSKIYINSVLKQNSDSSFDNNAYPLSHIGNYGSNSQGAIGYIDSVKAYDRALTQAEIIQDMHESDRPVLDMKFDSKSGTTTYDTSGNGNDGIVTGATWKTGANCKYGRCFSFDGSGDYVGFTVPTNIATNGFSVSFWFKWSGTWEGAAALPFLIGNNHGSAGNNIEFIIHTDSKLVFRAFSTTGPYSPVLQANTYYFVTGTMTSAGVMKLYVNGNYIGTINGNPTTNLTVGNGYIGQFYSGAYNFPGLIDSVKIYDRALTQREIAMEMMDGRHNPILDMDFEEAGGNTAYDGSFYGNDGTLTNDPTRKPAEDCISGPCVSFDGENDYVDVSNDNSLNFGAGDFSYGLWFKTTDTGLLYFLGKGSENYWAIRNGNSNAGHVACNVFDSEWRFGAESSTATNDGQWHQVFCVKDSSNIITYVDGIFEGSIALGDGDLSNTGNLYIGADYSHLQYIDGSIDSVNIYPYSLTPQEIKQEYNKGSVRISGDNPLGTKLHPGSSCMDIKQRRQGVGDGTYWIDPNGGSISDVFEVYCDMTTDGGGWTLVLHAVGGSSLSGYATTDSYNLGQSTNLDGTTFKFSDATINAIKSGSNSKYRVHTYGTYSYKRFWDASATYGHKTVCSGTNLWSYSDVDLTTDQHGGNSGGDMGICDYTGSGLYFQAKSDPASNTAWYLGSGTTYAQVNTGSSSSNHARMWVRATPTPSSSGLVLDMDFDLFDGTSYKDKSGNNNDGTPTGTVWKPAAYCKEGRCVEFDGSGDYVSGSDSSGNLNGNGAHRTVSAWIYQNAADQERVVGVFESQGSSQPQYAFFVTNDQKIRVQMKNSTGDYFANSHYSNSQYSLNNWHHIAFTYDMNQLKIYIDGKLDNTYSLTDAIRSDANPYFYVGVRGDEAAEFFNGFIDQIKIYNRSLTQAEISYLYNKGQPIGWWAFDEGSGTTAYDESGEGNHGSFSGDPQYSTNTSDCPMGYCLEFDGSDDEIVLSDTTIVSGDATVEAWINPVGTISAYYYVAYDTSNGLYITPTGAYFRVAGDESIFVSYSFPTNNWYNIVWTKENTTFKLYVNGFYIGTDTGSSENLLVKYLGSRGTIAYKFNGTLDDVRVYNYARTAEQIERDYNKGLAKIGSSTNVYYKSCNDIRKSVGSGASGTYIIDPDGSGGNDPFAVYCDMKTDGGGWTLLMRIEGDTTQHVDNNNQYGSSPCLTDSTTCKLSTDTITDMIQIVGVNVLEIRPDNPSYISWYVRSASDSDVWPSNLECSNRANLLANPNEQWVLTSYQYLSYAEDGTNGDLGDYTGSSHFYPTPYSNQQLFFNAVTGIRANTAWGSYCCLDNEPATLWIR